MQPPLPAVPAAGARAALVDDLWLTTGLSAINVRRHANVKESLVPNTTAFPTDVTYDN